MVKWVIDFEVLYSNLAIYDFYIDTLTELMWLIFAKFWKMNW